MYKTKIPLLTTTLLLFNAFDANALGINSNSVSKPIAKDDHISLTINTYTTAEGDLSGNDRYGTTFTFSGSWVGQYGQITKSDSEGEFTYEIFSGTSNDDLPSSGTGIERFQYTLTNEKGDTDTAWLIIDIHPDKNRKPIEPIAKDDHISTVAGVYTSASGNVTTNDIYGSIATLNGSWVGQYGLITSFDSEGEYSYELFKGTNNASLPPEEAGIDSFTYTYANASGQSDTAQLIIDVNPAPTSTEGSTSPIARDDNITAIPNKISTVSGNVTSNDSNGDYVLLTSSPSSEYGLFVLQSDGSYTYELYETSTSVIELKAGEVITDEFEYQYLANSGASTTATLTVQVIGNPVDGNGDPIFEQPIDEPHDNVDIEFNNRSAQATPLNSGRNIKGHLHDSGDKDWYSLSSVGDEIITLEVCPKGSSCFDKKSWVLYVFDSDLLTLEMEEKRFEFSRWVTETGTDKDLLGNTIITRTNVGSSNHMYLSYRAGFFDGALIGVVDPCFDALNSVDIGVPVGAKNYLIAISSPLRGDANKEGDAEDQSPCGAGSVVLQRPDIAAAGQFHDSFGATLVKSYATTSEYISVFPNSDDQYAIKITGTGLNPLLTDEAAAKSASFDLNTGKLKIPKVRVDDQVFQATLEQQTQKARSTDSPLKFILSDIEALSIEEVVDTYRATYNPENQQVLIPRVTDISSGKAYSVVMQYHASNEQPWFEAISIEEIQ